MASELVTWTITGIKPLMQNNPETMKARPVGTSRTKPTQVLPPFEEAEQKLYIEDGKLYCPAQYFWKAIVLACPNVNIGGKATSGIVPPAIEPAEEEFWLMDPATLNGKKKPRHLGAKDWVVDTRMVCNPKVGGLLVSRPKMREWGGYLILKVNRNYIPQKSDGIITDLLNIAGERGVGSGRLRRKENSSEWCGIRMGKFTATLK